MRRGGGAANEWAGDRGWQLGDFLALFDRGRWSWGARAWRAREKSPSWGASYLRSVGIRANMALAKIARKAYPLETPRRAG